jgi:hypothetical protein
MDDRAWWRLNFLLREGRELSERQMEISQLRSGWIFYSVLSERDVLRARIPATLWLANFQCPLWDGDGFVARYIEELFGEK